MSGGAGYIPICLGARNVLLVMYGKNGVSNCRRKGILAMWWDSKSRKHVNSKHAKSRTESPTAESKKRKARKASARAKRANRGKR